jgi:addiction module HigA family antidote
MSRSRTITRDDDRLGNVHPGEILREDFLIGSDIPFEEVVAGSGIAAPRLSALLNGEIPIDADIDLRLSRYFGTSEGFFLRLQNSYDLEEVRRDKANDLNRIVPRAA